MTFYYQPFSKRSYTEQWQRHLDHANVIANVNDIIKAQTEDHNTALRTASQQHAEIIQSSTEAICGTLSVGLERLAEQVSGVEDALHELSGILDWHLRTLIAEVRYNNLLCQNIALLIREPDAEKLRQRNIEKGLKFYNDAARDPSFFEDALHFLLKALEEDHTDYLVLHKLGLIYLYSQQHLDFAKAIAYFTRAAKYSEVDTHPKAVRLARILAGDATRSLLSQNASIDHVKLLTGESFLQTSIAYYAQGQFSEALAYAAKAVNIAPSLLEAAFTLAKVLAASGQNEKAAEVLKPVIQRDRNYSVRTLQDMDLVTKPPVLQMLEQLRMEERTQAAALLKEAAQRKESAVRDWKITESRLYHEFKSLCVDIDTAQRLVSENNYLGYLDAQRSLRHFIANM